MLDTASWIWLDEPHPDQYADFFARFTADSAPTRLTIACDSNYAAYVNGQLAAFGQYADYPHYKVCDEVDITPFVRTGENTFAVIVWYYGVESSCYTTGTAGLIYEISSGGKILAVSNSATLCRPDPGYIPGCMDKISGQLGLTFRRNGQQADDRFLFGEGLEDFTPAAVVEIGRNFHSRPNKKLVLRDRLPSKLCMQGLFTLDSGHEERSPSANMQYAPIAFRWLQQISKMYSHTCLVNNPLPLHTEEVCDGIYLLFDLGAETAGFLDLDLELPEACTIDIGWGEHLNDGRLRTSIRGFHCVCHAPAGRWQYMNPFRRLGCHYIQLFIRSKDVTVHYAGIRPTDYPVIFHKWTSGNLLRDTIYEVCQNTLLRCMHEHYEDCPWREQSLYCLDSRNQMLCGYYAFDREDGGRGEFEFARSSLRLIAEGLRDFGLLTICYPTMSDLCIPSFSCAYFIQMAEYIDYSGDTTLAAEVYDRLERLLSTFTSRIDDTGLLPSFGGHTRYWNFYEWAPTLSGALWGKVPERYEAPLCAFVSLAMQNMAKICRALGKNDRADTLSADAVKLNAAIASRFWDGTYFRTTDDRTEGVAVLTNALCLLCGAGDGLDVSAPLAILADNGRSVPGVIPTTLSMYCFRFDALLAADREKYAPVILDEIDRDYLYMLRGGATSFWETIEGAEDFSKAGSLCHGWSALPVYYYSILCEDGKCGHHG
ncbi:MAG: hypothetical protein IJ493_00240 [Clostridia bacterium]|nr:hypothetical protein [Clostridia bacterium]